MRFVNYSKSQFFSCVIKFLIFLTLVNVSCRPKESRKEVLEENQHKIKEEHVTPEYIALASEFPILYQKIEGTRAGLLDQLKDLKFSISHLDQVGTKQEMVEFLEIRDSFYLNLSDLDLINESYVESLSSMQLDQLKEELEGLGLTLFSDYGYGSLLLRRSSSKKIKESINRIDNISPFFEWSYASENLEKTILEFTNALLTIDSINSITDLEDILSQRDAILTKLHIEDDGELEWMDYFGEDMLNQYGIGIAWAENFPSSYVEFPIPKLSSASRRINEPFFLKSSIDQIGPYVLSGSNGEGSVSNPEFQVVMLGEQLLTKYPDHPYTQEMFDSYYFLKALHSYFSIHEWSDGNIYLGNFNTDHFDLSRHFDQSQNFDGISPSSRFAPVIAECMETMSAVRGGTDGIMYVEVPDLKYENMPVFADSSLNEAWAQLPEVIAKQESWFQYVWLGVDIAHNYTIRGRTDSGPNKTICVYRFYNDEELSEKALQEIRKVIPAAELKKWN